jgi:hypothetical protein
LVQRWREAEKRGDRREMDRLGRYLLRYADD